MCTSESFFGMAFSASLTYVRKKEHTLYHKWDEKKPEKNSNSVSCILEIITNSLIGDTYLTSLSLSFFIYKIG